MAGVTPYIGEIAMFAFGLVPKGWAQANGQMLSISGNEALFSLLGTKYGGDGRTQFGLPDLRGRTLIGTGLSIFGTEYSEGQQGGLEQVTLTAGQAAAHTHQFEASYDAGTKVFPSNDGYFAREGQGYMAYASADSNLLALNQQMVGNAGGGNSHFNVQPYLAISYCIATAGLYPSRS